MEEIEMEEWYRNLPSLTILELIPDAQAAEHTFVFSADMINDFCKPDKKNPKMRPLASSRVGAIARPIVGLLTALHNVNVENFILVQDCHDPDAREFEAFPPHAVRGTEGADTIYELTKLPFADKFIVFLKNTLSPAWAYREKRHVPPEKTHPIYPEGYIPVWRESFDRYLATHDIRTAIVVGNCSDLCVRELTMYLLMRTNEHQGKMRIVIPTNCVQTFDLPVDIAKKIGAMPHPGDAYHMWALYEMARNKIEVVRGIV